MSRLPRLPEVDKPTHVWVLFRTDGTDNGVVLCGTAYELSEAQRWTASATAKGAIRLPLGGLADGETW